MYNLVEQKKAQSTYKSLEGGIQSLTVKYDVSCRVFLDALYQFEGLRKFLSIPVLLSFHMNGCWDFWQMFFLHLFQSSPNRDDFAPWGYLPMCGDIFVGHNLRARCYWHLVGIARGCGKRPAVHKTALHNKDCLGQRSVLLRKPRSIHIIM